MFGSVFKGMDFTDIRVQVFWGIFTLVLLTIIIAMFNIFKVFIPKSKKKDLKTIEYHIRRLRAWMIFDRIAIVVDMIVLAVLILLHITSVINILEEPFIWIILVALIAMYCFFTAIFGRRGTMSHKQKMEKLEKMKKDCQ